MGKLEQTQQTTPTVEPALDPEVEAHLAPYLDTYRDLKQQADLLLDQMKIEKEKIYKEMQLFGVTKLTLAGLCAKEIRSTQSKLDKVKYVQLGGSLEILNSATVRKPKKPYLDIRAAGEEDHVDHSQGESD